MLTRRSFTRLLAGMSFVGAAAAAPAPREPRISLTRPEQKGVAGRTYFDPQGWDAAGRYGQTIRVAGFADGQNLNAVCFEVDLAAGWVGIFAHYFTHDGKLCLHHGDGGTVTYWVTGDVSVCDAMPGMKPYAGAKVLDKPVPPEFTDERGWVRYQRHVNRTDWETPSIEESWARIKEITRIDPLAR